MMMMNRLQMYVIQFYQFQNLEKDYDCNSNEGENIHNMETLNASYAGTKTCPAIKQQTSMTSVIMITS